MMSIRPVKYLLLRRVSQIGIFLLFLLGPWAGIWIIKGNLSSSLLLDTVPLTDPLVFLQMLATRHMPEIAAVQGVILVVLFYALVGGRVFCSWVCPINPVTDAASWLRRRYKITSGKSPQDIRWWLIGMILLASALSGIMVWEWVNPVSITQRALIFGGSWVFLIALAIFVLDLFIAPRAWCEPLCPVGASYALIGHKSLVRVSAQESSQCNDCAECFAVCPEPHILPAPLKAKNGISPVVLDSACTNCGRCIDVCEPRVFVFTHRFNHKRN